MGRHRNKSGMAGIFACVFVMSAGCATHTIAPQAGHTTARSQAHAAPPGGTSGGTRQIIPAPPPAAQASADGSAQGSDALRDSPLLGMHQKGPQGAKAAPIDPLFTRSYGRRTVSYRAYCGSTYCDYTPYYGYGTYNVPGFGLGMALGYGAYGWGRGYHHHHHRRHWHPHSHVHRR